MTDEANPLETCVEQIDDEDSRENLVCPHCIVPIEPGEHLCHNCGGPITAHSMIDPLGHLWAMGYGYRNLTGAGRQPSKLALIGIWMIFGPASLYCIYWVMDALAAMRKSFDGAMVFQMAISSALLAIQLMILDRVTRNYFEARRQHGSEPPPDADSLEEEYDW